MSDIGLSREFDDCANELKLDGWKFFFSVMLLFRKTQGKHDQNPFSSPPSGSFLRGGRDPQPDGLHERRRVRCE